MSETRRFKEQHLTLYFGINGIRSADWIELPEDQAKPAQQINSRAYALLEASLPKLPEWTVVDEHEPEIPYSPFEVCEEDNEPNLDAKDALLAPFHFSIYSYRPIDEATARAFSAEVKKCYAEAAEEVGGQCEYLYAEAYVASDVFATSRLEV